MYKNFNIDKLTIDEAMLVLKSRVTESDLDYLAPDIKNAILTIRDREIKKDVVDVKAEAIKNVDRAILHINVVTSRWENLEMESDGTMPIIADQDFINTLYLAKSALEVRKNVLQNELDEIAEETEIDF